MGNQTSDMSNDGGPSVKMGQVDRCLIIPKPSDPTHRVQTEAGIRDHAQHCYASSTCHYAHPVVQTDQHQLGPWRHSWFHHWGHRAHLNPWQQDSCSLHQQSQGGTTQRPQSHQGWPWSDGIWAWSLLKWPSYCQMHGRMRIQHLSQVSHAVEPAVHP